MTFPSHTLRVPRRVVEFFGSELELIAALNRLLNDFGDNGWDKAEMVDVVVPHDTWEKTLNERGHHQIAKLRNCISLAIVERGVRAAANERQPGTLMIAQKLTVCPFCNVAVRPGTLMVNTFASDGSTRAVHVECANRENVPYRATGKLEKNLEWLKRRTVAAWLRREAEKWDEQPAP